MPKQWDDMDPREKLEYLRDSLIRANRGEVELHAHIRALKWRVKALEGAQESNWKNSETPRR